METIDQNMRIISAIQKGNFQAASQFKGFGGLQRALTPQHRQVLATLLNPNELEGVMQSLRTGYYTPALLVKFIWAYVQRLGFTGGKILEPACGSGRFFQLMPEAIRKTSQITGVELDPLSAKIATHLYPDIQVCNQGFETFDQMGFDLIVGNPPYSSARVYDPQHRDLDDAIHHFFVAKSARLLNPNGLLAMVLPSYVLDNVKNHLRDKIAESVNLVASYRLPENLFAHAKVTIDVAFFKQSDCLDKHWVKTQTVTVEGNHTFPMSCHFVENPAHVIGRLGRYRCWLKSQQRERTGLCCRGDYEETKAKLKAILDNLSDQKIPSMVYPILSDLKQIRSTLDGLISLLQ